VEKLLYWIKENASDVFIRLNKGATIEDIEAVERETGFRRIDSQIARYFNVTTDQLMKDELEPDELWYAMKSGI
jgi:cell wall assembly regulator SMI1